MFRYGNKIACVKWADGLFDPRLEYGVRPGGLSSPSLFYLYINGLIEELSKQHVGYYIEGICLNIVSYADEMVLLRA
ncbi:unnamed protein product [Pieris brassicae]|uniref:Reverse transcriptase domain-containing protein n=1 Tax=Pieris brassicae TaxID=7116 RepID=A0A9P0X5M5_PIEBR|nr:unnamed protein product [Pieris brassicae]